MFYTITLNPALDYYMSFSEKNIDKLMRAKETKILPGGKGINASILLTKLGVPNVAIILTGKPTGPMLLDILDTLNIKYKNFDIKNQTRINVKADINDTYELSASTINKNIGVSKEIYQYLEKVLKPNDIVMVMGTTMQGLDSDIIDNISKISSSKQARMVYDIEGSEILNYLKYKPLVIKPNTLELGNYFHTNIDTFDKIKKNANKLLDLGAENVIVSQDKDGAYLFNKFGIIKTNPLKINLVNSSGAGDSMISGFVYKLLETNDYTQAINFANASGAGTASAKSIANVDVINSLYRKVTNKKIGEKNVK